jgi:sporadic carbohydrate cluster 2OG-Fe(II) oxygenase
MNIFDEIVKTKGYAIISIENMNIFESLKNSFIEKINIENKIKNIDSLRKKMATMSKSEINKIMVNLLSFSDASELMINSCKNIVKNLCGDRLFIQRRAATIFNLPGKDQRRQWPHYELMSGISPFTYIMWAPFHDLDDDGGVFYMDQTISLKTIKKEHKQGLVNGPLILNNYYNEKPLKLKYGEVVIFNPFILHGNINFSSDKARIACSVRFQSIKKPLMQRNTDFYKYLKIN